MDPYGIDYREYKKKFGRNVFLAGNIDVELKTKEIISSFPWFI